METTHNSKVGNNLVFCVETTTRASLCEHDVASWLVTAVNQTYPVKHPSYPHSLVIGTWHDNHADEGAPTGRVLNRLLAVTHVENVHFAEHLFKGLVIPTEIHPPVTLSAEVMATILQIAPIPAVGAVGVSAVSDEVAAELWDEIVRTDSHSMDNSGKGYMTHPAYHYDEHDGVWECPERSCNFGWGAHAEHTQQGER